VLLRVKSRDQNNNPVPNIAIPVQAVETLRVVRD
jgi:hypothetical protein